jgi:molybdopterin synthase catalytic subunit
VSAAAGSDAAGAISLFIGTTRDNFEGKRVVTLEYEAYVPMAESEMRKLCVTTREKFPGVLAVVIHHRLGRVPVAEASVVIAVSSPHRKIAINACHFTIDKLKATVPIWKREMYEDGSTWKENTEFLIPSGNVVS